LAVEGLGSRIYQQTPANFLCNKEVSMKSQPISASLSLFLLACMHIITRVCAQRENYNVRHTPFADDSFNHPPFSDLSDLNALMPRTLLRTDKMQISNMWLTPEDISSLSPKLQMIDSKIAPITTVSIPSIPPHRNPPKITVNCKTPGTWLKCVPKCPQTVNNVEVFLADTVIDPMSKGLKWVDITYDPNAEPVKPPFNQHSTEVASTIFSKKYGVVSNGKPMIYNYMLFGLSGTTNSTQVIASFNAAIQRNNYNKQRGVKTIMNLSISGGGHDDLQDDAANAAVEAGVWVFVAAGNEGFNVCGSESPADASKVFSVCGTEYPGNNLIYFSDWGPCDKMCMPAQIAMYDGTSLQGYRGKWILGTSFAVPQVVALAAIDATENPDHTFTDAQDTILARTVPVNSTYGGTITVMLQDTACPSPTAAPTTRLRA